MRRKRRRRSARSENTRYGSVAHAERRAPAARAIDCEQRDAARRRIVEDHQPIGDAAQLGDATAASRGVCISTRRLTTASKLAIRETRAACASPAGNVTAAPASSAARCRAMASISSDASTPVTLAPRRAPAAARRGRCRCRRRGSCAPRSSRRSWPAPRACVAATRSPIGPPKRRSSKRAGGVGIGVERVAVVVAGGARSRHVLHGRDRRRAGRSPARRRPAGSAPVGLVAVLRLGQVRGPARRSPAARAGSASAARMPSANSCGRRRRSESRCRRRAPACASAAASPRSAFPSAGTGRSSAACWCRASAATPARRRPAGRRESPPPAARRQTS